jgi:molybdopterin/thiamine biosynthesis adenylyltransferase
MDTGLYTIDPFDSFAGPARQTDGYDALVTIAGLGGTGAFLAEDLARLLSMHFGWRVHFHLADHDRVEVQNAQRQAGLRGIKAWYACLAEHAFEVGAQWSM